MRKKQNGGWKVSDAGWPFFFLWSELIRVQFYFIFLFDPSWTESIQVDPDWRVRVDPVWLLYLPDSEAYMLLVDFKNVMGIWFIDINTKTDKQEES